MVSNFAGSSCRRWSMQLSFTPAAVRKLRSIMEEKGGNLALRIRIRRSIRGLSWQMTLEPAEPEAILVDGVPIHADKATQHHLDGLIIDWTQTPDGEGFGVYDRSMIRRDWKLGAD